MKMASCTNYVFVSLIFPVMWLSFSTQLVSGKGNKSYVEEACSVTRYRDLCIHSLASFSTSAKNSPSRWARAGVSVSLSETKSAAHYLVTLKKHRRGMQGRNKVALSDCIECFGNAIDELHKSLGVLRTLTKTTFDSEMADLETWLSAALTDGYTCLDGFEGQKGKQVKLLQKTVSKVTHITSNALALVNKLATTGLGSLPNL
ncbi:21 kDa protein-like [Pyrus ussuriensis x Pyrus communis]|uniref:21 kDa protein-like n=1 Tax=Pyrus ussuriensis x Pyrus communis TaxID=2448454 RepID=A0A5N5GL26_9ROSA|nr:21 kDa protein-like [Pyrus ussuriensis x Pyrus communis]